MDSRSVSLALPTFLIPTQLDDIKTKMTRTDDTRYLEVVVHPGAHKLPEGVVRPLPDPAVDGHALGPEANGLRLELAFLQETQKAGG